MSSYVRILLLLTSIYGYCHNTDFNYKHQPKNSIDYINIGNDTIYYKKINSFSSPYSIDSDTQIIWEKLNNYIKKIEAQGKITDYNFLEETNNYSKDSTKILLVKLFSIKALDEKKLLNKDILENEEYYATLLQKLKNSDLEASYYLFLERRFTLLQIEKTKKNYTFSLGLNILAILLIIGMGYIVYRLKLRLKKESNPQLSKQEETIKNLILSGKSNKEIANELYISISTVKTHITNIYNKLNISGRKELSAISKIHTGTST